MGKLSSEGVIYVAYYDLRDAMKAQRGSRETWLVQFCKATKLLTVRLCFHLTLLLICLRTLLLLTVYIAKCGFSGSYR